MRKGVTRCHALFSIARARESFSTHNRETKNMCVKHTNSKCCSGKSRVTPRDGEGLVSGIRIPCFTLFPEHRSSCGQKSCQLQPPENKIGGPKRTLRRWVPRWVSLHPALRACIAVDARAPDEHLQGARVTPLTPGAACAASDRQHVAPTLHGCRR